MTLSLTVNTFAMLLGKLSALTASYKLSHLETMPYTHFSLFTNQHFSHQRKAAPAPHSHSDRKCVLLLRNSFSSVSVGGLLVNIIMASSIGEEATFFSVFSFLPIFVVRSTCLQPLKMPHENALNW